MKTKRILIISFLALILCSGLLWSQAKSPLEESFVYFDKMVSTLKLSSVIGEPIRSGETYIIPFAKISYGLGAGGMMMGYGGGMGGKSVPLGILIVEGEEVRVELFPLEEQKPSLLQEMLPVLLKILPQMLEKKIPSISKPPSTEAKAPGKPEKPAGEGSLKQVQKLFDEKKYSEALEMADSLLAKDPNNSDLHVWKGNIMGTLAQGNPVDMIKYGMGAMQEFAKAVELDPNNARAHFGQGMGRLMSPPGFGQDLDGAIEDFEFACKKEPSPEAHYYLGVAYRNKGLTDKAREAFKKTLELQPDHKDAAKALAEIK